MEILKIGDLTNSIIERGEISLELEMVEDEKTKERNPTGKMIPDKFSIDIEVKLDEEKTYYFLWFLSQDDRDLRIDRGNISINLKRCKCKRISYTDANDIINCLISYQEGNIQIK